MQKRVRRVKGVSINNKKEYWKCNILENIRPLICPAVNLFKKNDYYVESNVYKREL